ncbi:pleckstrin homology domain-containing family F member 1-like [Protopterus annectens]|uniref:pleckstrin homology domain-containing family F member 1-like n=1 Tax=Protopterus annectens TaxID=7888 RepID=UPI001CFAEA3A|nr:pleckstrin homology domain-containing family F member 1-like [Protopterus annectens]
MRDLEEIAFSKANVQRIAMVENFFGGCGQPLAKDGRILVGEGILRKECRKTIKIRMFFLFSDILVYGKILIMNRKYISQHIIPLSGITVESLPDMEKIQNRWMIKSEKKSFVVSTGTLKEKKEWIRHIEDCVKDEAMKTGRISTVELAAPWIPDSASDICMRCTKIKFSFIQRRHHCRKCGFVVCGDCSNQKLMIPTISKEPQKVCLLCYNIVISKEWKQQQEQKSHVKHIGSFFPGYKTFNCIDDNDKPTNNTFVQSAIQEDYSSFSLHSSFHS